MSNQTGQADTRGAVIADTLVAPQRRDRGEPNGGEQTRLTRVQELRDSDPVHGFEDIDYSARPDHLKAPEAQPGMMQRWIARKVMGDSATAMPTYTTQMAQGWAPRPANTVKGYDTLRVDDVNLGFGIIERNGLILCERPSQISKNFRKAKDRATARQTDGVQAAIDQTAREGGIPIRTVNRSRTTRGRRAVEPASDFDNDGL